MRFVLSSVLLALLFITGCAKPPVQTPVYELNPPTHQVDYITEVKPVLVQRCVVCHSCYNSPCQLKLSSWEGLERGASKEKIYNGGRLSTMEPSRLFIDAASTKEWRQKGFSSVLQEESKDYEESLMFMMLNHKRLSPEVSGEYNSEASDLTCAENEAELSSYLDKHPNRGMPFGFPPLKQQEFDAITGWLMQGAQGPTTEQQAQLLARTSQDQQMISKWEEFFNTPNPKHGMTARYLYEHLFLAHISFETGSNEFYELVRSRTKLGEKIDIIATIRPYDDPGTDEFYYRFRKIHSTIVHKTHMVFSLGEKQFDRISELFITPTWEETPHLVSYDAIKSANPFETYQQIPAKSRYQWLLDNVHYTIMTFIRGPVCKGQVALNVIHDHFWLMFLDPEYDLSVRYPGFLKMHSNNLRMPAEAGSHNRLYKALFSNNHYKWAVDYYKARQQFYGAIYPKGLGVESIWKGNQQEDASLLTVFRHFDSASVHRGVLGGLPRTMWLIDYPLLERIYYALVAGFDVYGTAGHQLSTRLYMDALRIEGESYFLDLLSEDKRKDMMASWYIGVKPSKIHYTPAPIAAGTAFETEDEKREFVEKVVNDHIIAKDISFDQNYLKAGDEYPKIPAKFETIDDVVKGFIASSAPGVSFFRHASGHGTNLAWIRIKNIPDKNDVIVSGIVDRWHDNVRYLFKEKYLLDPSKDRADFVKGFVGSYPNYFIVVDYKDLGEFFVTLDEYDGSEEYIRKMAKFGVNRANDNFWEVYDWFQKKFDESDPKNSGLADLNRYHYRAVK